MRGSRELVDDIRTVWKVSIRRACRNLCVDTSSYHYKPRRPSQASLRERIKEIAETRVRYGYRRIHVLLRREGWVVNAKRVNRLYREMGLQLRNKSPKRKVKAKLREGRSAPVGSNDVWAMDFVHDQLYDGRKIRILTVIDAFTRYVPAIDVRERYTGADVVTTLEAVCRETGYPKSIRVDRDQSSSRRTSTCGPTRAVSSSTSHGREADRQRVHREPEREVPRRVPIGALVPEPCRRAAKMRALA